MEGENLDELKAQNIQKEIDSTEIFNGESINLQNNMGNNGNNMNSGDGIITIPTLPQAQNSKSTRTRKTRYRERVRPVLYRESKTKAKQLIRNIARGIVVREVKPAGSIKKATRSQFLFPRRMNSKSSDSFMSDTTCSRCGHSCCYRFH